MSNNKSLRERLNNIKDEGASKWISRQLSFKNNLFEGPAERLAGDDAVAMGGTMAPTESPKDPIVPPQRPQMSVSSGAESGGSSPAPTLGDRVINFVRNQSAGFKPVTKAQKTAARRAGDPEPTQGTAKPHNAARKKLVERLDDEVSGPKIKRFLDRSQELQESNKEKFERLKNITARFENGELDYDTTLTNARRFITEGLGYGEPEEEGGKFTLPEHGMELADQIYHGAPPGNSGQRSTIPGHIIQHLIDDRKNANPGESRLEKLRAAIDPEGIAKTSDDLVINEIPWRMATALHELLPDGQSWNKMGASGNDRFINSTDMNYEFVDGKFTGKIFNSPDDTFMGDNFDEVNSNHMARGGGSNRGIALLQKLLSTAGVDGFSGSPDFISPLTGSTIDHGVGVSESGAMNRPPELLRNLIITGSGYNKWKLDKSYQQVLDAVERAANGGMPEGGEYDVGEDEDDHSHWLYDLAKDKAFTPGLIDKSEYFDGKGFLRGLNDGSSEIDDLINMDYEMQDPRQASFHSLTKNQSENRITGEDVTSDNDFLSNLRLSGGLMSPSPRKNITGRGQEWGGKPESTAGADNLGDDSLQYLRKAMFLNSMFGEEFRDELSHAKEEFGDDNQAIQKYLDNIFDVKYAGPLKSVMSAWSSGLTTHDNYQDELGEFGEKMLGKLKGKIPQTSHDLLARNLDEEGLKYLELMKKAINLDPETFNDSTVHKMGLVL
jgi:hypothetical protein